MNALRWTVLTTIVCTYGLIVLGAWVRSTNSGLSCPDWPTCYGVWVITPGQFEALGDVGYSYFQVMLEWVHRAIAGVIVGPLILGVLALSFVVRRDRPVLLRWAIALCVLLLVQASLGGLTVLDRNSPWSVALHLGTALVLFSVLWRLFVGAGERVEEPVSPVTSWLAHGAWIAALVTMVTAAMTAKSGASLACSTWPTCNGAWFPVLDEPLIRLHAMHRYFAAGTALLVVALALVAWRESNPIWRRLVTGLAAVIAMQIVFGALVIVWYVPTWTAVLHQATGIALFAGLSFALWRARLAPTFAPDSASSMPKGIQTQG